MEPWPECQPEQLIGSLCFGGGYFGLAFVAGWEAWRFLTNCRCAPEMIAIPELIFVWESTQREKLFALFSKIGL